MKKEFIIIHYGNELQKEIEDKGFSKKKIAETLGISYNTLMARINDGNFTREQLKKLVEKRYL